MDLGIAGKQEQALRHCAEWCIANVDGRCAVAECGGPISAIRKTTTDIHTAAKYYGFSLAMFREEFGE